MELAPFQLERGLSVFRRLMNRIRKPKKKGKDSEATSETTPEDTRFDSPSEDTTPPPTGFVASRAVPQPMGTLVAESDRLIMDPTTTRDLAKAASIFPQETAEIVPGKALKRDAKGRIHIKIVFYGPSLSGKTTALRWLFANVRSLTKSRIVEVSDELGRTTFFDFVPISATESMVFDVFTVAGQRRHAASRITVLRDVDGLIFMADSAPEQMNENLASIQELEIALGTDRMATMPIVVALNKRDLPNALPAEYMLEMLDLQEYPVFETIAKDGKNLLRMFQRILRDALIFKVGP